MPSPSQLHSRVLNVTPGRELVLLINGIEIIVPLGLVHTRVRLEVIERDRTQAQVQPGTVTTRPAPQLSPQGQIVNDAAVKGLTIR